MSQNIKLYDPPAKRHKTFLGEVGIPSRGAKLNEAINQGFKYAVYTKLADLSGIQKNDIAAATLITRPTLNRRAKSGQFNRSESDRLYRFAKVFTAAIELFEGNKSKAQLWMKKPVRGLGGQRPIEMIGTTAESETVLDLINRLEHGIIA